MEKEDLLKIVEKEELKRIDKLSDKVFWEELRDWFCITDEDLEDWRNEDNISRRNIYMEDFMNWKSQYSIEELQDLLVNGYNKKVKI